MEALSGDSSLWSGSNPCGKFVCHSQPCIRLEAKDASLLTACYNIQYVKVTGKGNAVARGGHFQKENETSGSAAKNAFGALL